MLLEVNQLCAGYGKAKVLGPMSFVLGKGQLMLINGRNGSGKTTLIKTLLKEIKPISGNITWEIPLSDIGYLPQLTDSSLYTSITVAEIYDLYGVEQSTREFAGLELLGKKWINLSGGEKQKVMLLTRVTGSVSTLILDEPYNHLDHQSSNDLKELIVELVNSFGISIIIVSHQSFDYSVKDKRVLEL